MKLGDFRRSLRNETNPDKVVPCPSCDGRGWSTPGVVSCDDCDGKGTVVIGVDLGMGDDKAVAVAMRKEKDGSVTVLASEEMAPGASEADLSRRIREKLREPTKEDSFTDPTVEEMADREICERHPDDPSDEADHRFCEGVQQLGLSMGSRFIIAGGKDYMWASEPVFGGKATDPRSMVAENDKGVLKRSVYTLLVEPMCVPTLARVAAFHGASKRDLIVKVGLECDETGAISKMLNATAFCCYPADTRPCKVCGGKGTVGPAVLDFDDRASACSNCRGLGRVWGFRAHPKHSAKPSKYASGEVPLDTRGAVWRARPKRP